MLSNDVEYKNLIKSKTYIKGDANPSERIAIQVAIKKAVESFGIKKFFSFHNTIKRSDLYVSGKSSMRHFYIKISI